MLPTTILQVWWIDLIHWLNDRVNKDVDGRTDGRTDAGDDNKFSAGEDRVQKVISLSMSIL